MFRCYDHGWSSEEKPCPVCHPVGSGTVATDTLKIFADQTVPDGTAIIKNAEGEEIGRITNLQRNSHSEENT